MDLLPGKDLDILEHITPELVTGAKETIPWIQVTLDIGAGHCG